MFVFGALIEEVRFAVDSPLEGERFEPSVPRMREHGFQEGPWFRERRLTSRPGSFHERGRRFESFSILSGSCAPDRAG